MNKNIIIAFVVSAVFLIAISIILLFFHIFHSASKSIQGSWICNDEIIVNIGKKNFDMISNDESLIVNSTYVINEIEVDNNYHKYTFDAKAIKRIINGKDYTDSYTTRYQMVIDSNIPDEAGIINVVTNNIYTCKKK